MMNSYFLEILMKERQKQISEEFKRIHMSRAGRNPGVGFLKKIYPRIWRGFIAVGDRLQKQYRSSVKPSIRGHDSCSPK